MKKFLSLLLAMTMVMSLIVLPARAHDGEVTLNAGKSVIEINDQTTVLASLSSGEYASGYPKWTIDDNTKATLSASDGATTATVTGKAATTGDGVTITCTYKLNADASQEQTAVLKIKVNAPDCTKGVATVSFNGVSSPVTSDNKADYYPVAGQTGITKDSFTFTYKTGFDRNTGDVVYTENTSLAVPIKATAEGASATGTTTITLVKKEVTAPTNLVVTAPSSIDNYFAGQNITFSVTAPTNFPSGASYVWEYKVKNSQDNFATLPGTVSGSTITTKALGSTTDTVYTISCKAKLNKAKLNNVTTTAVTADVTIKADPYTLKAGLKTSATLSPNSTLAFNSTWTPAPYLEYKGDPTKNVAAANLTYTLVSSDTAVATISRDGKTVNAGTKAGPATITATVTYNGKNYGKLTYSVRNSVLEATLTAVQNNTATYLDGRNYYGNLGAAAQAALIANGISGTVSTVALNTASVTNGRITGTNYYYTFTGSSIGVSTFTGTVTLTNGSVYTMTFKVPVTPISTTYEAQYPEPVAYGNTYRYYVQVPAGASYYYVVGTPNQATIPTDFSQSGKTVYYANTTSTNLYPLTDSNFVGGQCTLWIVTKNSSDNRLYYGQLTVYQKNYNINYNGVAGETVQFAQSDFTDFMTEIAEARGDASKTKSYPYVTFDYVTFSLPTTAQGTLYYGGTAMSTSNSSGAFNTRTKVTNLDSVTFVPNAKTTAKTITLNFTLHATRYSSSSTSLGTTVSYSGSVVVNLVREDIKYTVSQGDSVRFDESDFLSYLRSTKGYSSNYTIDYVTFDQSAVSAVNEGSLYTYYNGYNYGGSVKTTDKFYYSATASQNALSDVAFLASRYAKTGETVYIPFTIYARYGTTGTGTRQLTGTVAIKIGQTMNFIDVKTTDYFYNSVKWAVGKNITNGTSSTTFSPYKSCTRAEIVTFLWRAAGSPEPTITRNPFRDVNAVTHSSYYKAILWASQKGITSGTSATAFSPDQVCTRAQIVTFLYRYAGQPSGYYSNPFKDVSATNEASYYNAILWASGKGITTGSSPTTFSPYASCNRAEAVTFLYRYTNGL